MTILLTTSFINEKEAGSKNSCATILITKLKLVAAAYLVNNFKVDGEGRGRIESARLPSASPTNPYFSLGHTGAFRGQRNARPYDPVYFDFARSLSSRSG